jgi:hypothetical protein
MPRRPLIVAALLSLALLIPSLVFPVPALTDPTGGPLPTGLHLAFPVLNIILAPLFDAWDGVTLLAMPLLRAFLLGAVVLIATWSLAGAVANGQVRWLRATARLAMGVLGLGLFVLAGIRWRRPMAHLEGVPSDRWVVDLHSHTSLSHDAKGILQRDFDLETSRAWHSRGGYDAFFVTDHNLLNREALLPQEGNGKTLPWPVACPGEELSLWGAHIVVLGNSDSIPKEMYADSAPGITRILLESGSRWHGVTLASVPEYDQNHFADLPEWIASGVDGFEVSNAAPKANQQSVTHRDSVIALARANGRWLAGVSDQHGMGATVQAWTLVPRIDAPAYDHSMPARCQQVLVALSTKGSAATQVIERHRLRVDSAWPRWATVIAVIWEGWRAAGMAQLASWLAWIWGIALFRYRSKPTGDPSAADATSG